MMDVSMRYEDGLLRDTARWHSRRVCEDDSVFDV